MMNIRNDARVDINGDAALLVAALRDPAIYPHPVRRVGLLETHISWVLLTGSYAYKIKKPVDLGFLNFTALAARRHFCEEELRLNRRLAPAIYLEVVPITGTMQRPLIGGDGPAIEYAVKMREFAQEALLDNALARGDVEPAMIEELGRTIAGFHAELVPQDTARGGDTGASVLAPARDNFAQIEKLLDTPTEIATLAALRDWTLREYEIHLPHFEHRYAEGCVRECHGDLHAGNIVVLDGAAVPFDGIEFNPALRWMDVMNEAAFPMMDLAAHDRRDLAYAFINAYLESSGDYSGVRLLPFYSVYRAVVRAKVNLIRATQPGATPAGRERALEAYRRYITLAAVQARGARGAVIITHGVSGSGKTTLTREMLAALGAIRIRSDVERKRLHRLDSLARATAAPGSGIYADNATAYTYDRLLFYAREIAGAGLPVIADATFLKFSQRAAFHALAQELGVPFIIVSISANPAELRARVAARAARGNDASDATLEVLEAQLATCEALTDAEMRHAVHVAGGTAAAYRAVHEEIARRLHLSIPVPG